MTEAEIKAIQKVANRLHWAVNGGVRTIGEIKQIMREVRGSLELLCLAKDGKGRAP